MCIDIESLEKMMKREGNDALVAAGKMFLKDAASPSVTNEEKIRTPCATLRPALSAGDHRTV